MGPFAEFLSFETKIDCIIGSTAGLPDFGRDADDSRGLADDDDEWGAFGGRNRAAATFNGIESDNGEGSRVAKRRIWLSISPIG